MYTLVKLNCVTCKPEREVDENYYKKDIECFNVVFVTGFAHQRALSTNNILKIIYKNIIIIISVKYYV